MPNNLVTTNMGTTSEILSPLPRPAMQGCVVIKESAPCTPAGKADYPMMPSIISATLVVIGWFVVTKTQANRERRKQIREFASDLMDRLGVLEKLAVEYHTSERDQTKEHEIISKLARFEKACDSIQDFVEGQCFFGAAPKSALEIDAKQIQQFRRAMTLNHFADEHTEVLTHQSDLIQEFEIAVCAVLEELERVRIATLD
jgi:hypothetical protein